MASVRSRGARQPQQPSDAIGGLAPPPPVHRLCAILFTDIVGSTVTMQADEVEARRVRDRHREAVDSAVGAVRCAREIQLAVRADPAVPLRIGVHSGDIVHDEIKNQRDLRTLALGSGRPRAAQRQ